MTTDTIGTRIRLIREERGWPQTELAEKMGVARETIWRWETGESRPQYPSVRKLARVCEVSADWLLGLDE